MNISRTCTDPLEPEKLAQLILIGSIAVLLLLIPLLLFFHSSYRFAEKVPECDAPVVLDQLRNSGLAVSLSASGDSVESVAFDRALGHRICLLKQGQNAGDDGRMKGVKFVVRMTDHLPSLLRVEVVSDRVRLKQAGVSGHTIDEF